MREQHIADIATGKTGYWPSMDACRWTVVDADTDDADRCGC